MSKEDLYVVGIGASAGGLDAIEKFFNNMPHNPGMAFVIIQHLSPDYKSLMDEILSKHTNMEIIQAKDNIEVEANKIYLLPPKNNLKLFHGKLYLTPHKGQRSLNLPIDIFFRSLAEDKKEKGIAVILSGTGSDGTRGIRHIKELGGMVIVQDQNTAQFDGMPRSAIIAGMVDFILAPEEMGDSLVKYIKNPIFSQTSNKIIDDQEPFQKIFEMLKRYSGVDFSFYKKSTVIRRIEQRMGINQLSSIEDYLEFLYDSTNEINILYKQLLIGVTRFFRDKEAYEIVRKKVIPELMKSKAEKEALRIWVAGCSTGEEAYSMALLFQDFFDTNEQEQDYKIFATDIDKDAIEFAGQGIYPESIAEDVPEDYLKKYFKNTGGFFQVNRDIREKLVFAPHNLIQNPPFNNMDFISCRNLLIYLQPMLQKKVFSFFSYSLKKYGFLFLGSSETIGEMDNYYKTFSNRWKIYQLTNTDIKHSNFPHSFSLSRLSSVKFNRNLDVKSSFSSSSNDDYGVIQDYILQRFVNPCVVVDDSYNIIMTCGDAKKYLELPTGRIQINALKLFRKELSIPIGIALHKVIKNEKEVFYPGISLERESETEFLDLSVFMKKVKDRKYLIIVLKQRDVKKREESDIRQDTDEFFDDKDQRIKDLEQELQYTKENLQATIEELETSNEELQAANEELLSSNEELQSTNEELQSVNEELITVNSEYQAKIQELTDLNNDMENLLKNTDIGTIFLDLNLRIRKFTPAVGDIINIMDQDIGRPISHISHNLKGGNIYEDAKDVLMGLKPKSSEVENKFGRRYFKRIRPYITTDNQVKGVVITFLDITDMKAASKEISKFNYAIDQSPVMICLFDSEGKIEYANPQFLKKSGYELDEVMGKEIDYFQPEKDDWQREYEKIKQMIRRGEKYSHEIKVCGKFNCLWEMVSISKVYYTGEEDYFYLMIAEDITDMKIKRKAIEEEYHFLKVILEDNPNAILFLDAQGHITYANQKAEEITKLPKDEIISRSFDSQQWEITTEEEAPLNSEELPFAKVMRTKKPVINYTHQITDGAGARISVRVNATPKFSENNKISGVIVSLEKS